LFRHARASLLAAICLSCQSLSNTKKPVAIRDRFDTPIFLATCLTWLQADRPNHHGIKLS
jgi:hypothetical protein